MSTARGHPQGVSLTWTDMDIHRGSVSRGRIWTSTGGQSHVDACGHPHGVSLTWTDVDIHRGSVSRGRMWTSTGGQSHVDACGHPQGVSLTWTHVDRRGTDHKSSHADAEQM